jgi:hypothetical protein
VKTSSSPATRSSPTASCARQMKKIKPSGFWNLCWLGGKTHLHRGEVARPRRATGQAARTST